ncbi:MAG TPA: hypothetical protein VLA13_10275 [Massilibacterium sp.]|nr:hypothetical protein [Massilibacterium sp.]
MEKTDIIAYLQDKGLKAPEAMEAVNMCDKYIEANTKTIKVKATYNFANMVDEMRRAQRQRLSGQKTLEKKVDGAIIKIQKHYKLIGN